MACSKFLTMNSGFKMPALGLGTWRAPDDEIESTLNHSLEIGYRHIDCAPVYLNEKAVGRVLHQWLSSNKIKRSELFVVSKLPPTGNRSSCVEKFLRKSLIDLQLSYVDLYLIHVPFGVPETDGDFAHDENGDIILDYETDHIATWKKMEDMVNLGLAKSIGVSNFNKKQLQKLLDNSNIKPSCLQIELHIYLQQNEMVDFCKQNNIIVTAYSPLGSKGISVLDKMAGINRNLPDLMENPFVLEIAKTHNKTPAQILLRWIIERDVAAIPKSTNPQRLRQNIEIFDFSLNKDEMNELSKLDSNLRICDFSFFKGIKAHPEFPW